MRIAYPIKLFDGSAMDISNLWRILGRPVENGDYLAGIIKPELSCAPDRSPSGRWGLQQPI